MPRAQHRHARVGRAPATVARPLWPSATRAQRKRAYAGPRGPPLEQRREEASRRAGAERRPGRHGRRPVEAEKDPGEQGVQFEAPAAAGPARQPLNSMAPLHACGHRPHPRHDRFASLTVRLSVSPSPPVCLSQRLLPFSQHLSQPASQPASQIVSR